MIWKMIALLIICLLMVMCYALMVMAHDADERAERMYRKWKEQLEYDFFCFSFRARKRPDTVLRRCPAGNQLADDSAEGLTRFDQMPLNRSGANSRRLRRQVSHS